MSKRDYYLCDQCQEKCFYDADIPDRFEQAGKIKAICKKCAETHTISIDGKAVAANIDRLDVTGRFVWGEPYVLFSDHQQALAEKDREIQQIREHEFQNGYREGEAAAKDALAEKDRVIAGLSGKVKNLTKWSDIMFGTPCEEIRHAQQMEELEEKYKKLLGQAVRFAEAYRNAHLSSWLDLVIEELAEEMATKDPVYVEAQAFLKEHS